MRQPELEDTQITLNRVGVIPLEGGGYKGTYAHCSSDEENKRVAIVTSKAPTPGRALDAARRWVLRTVAEEETKRAWLERASEIDPLLREPEPGPKYDWREHPEPEHKGYFEVVRTDTVDPTPCLEPA